MNTTTYPAEYTTLVGKHRLVGWGDYPALRDAILPRVFGYLVGLATPVVKEFHGDLFHDAETLPKFLDAALAGSTYAQWNYCVRHSGTNMNGTATIMFESLAYDAALYNLHLYMDDRREWWLEIDLLDARPSRPGATASTEHSAAALGLNPVVDPCTCNARAGGYSTHLSICPAHPSWV